MEQDPQPHRCPHCQALVVDRRSPVCTTCRAALPAAWVMSPAQTATVTDADRRERAYHRAEMRFIDTILPNYPA